MPFLDLIERLTDTESTETLLHKSNILNNRKLFKLFPQDLRCFISNHNPRKRLVKRKVFSIYNYIHPPQFVFYIWFKCFLGDDIQWTHSLDAEVTNVHETDVKIIHVRDRRRCFVLLWTCHMKHNSLNAHIQRTTGEEESLMKFFRKKNLLDLPHF